MKISSEPHSKALYWREFTRSRFKFSSEKFSNKNACASEKRETFKRQVRAQPYSPEFYGTIGVLQAGSAEGFT